MPLKWMSKVDATQFISTQWQKAKTHLTFPSSNSLFWTTMTRRWADYFKIKQETFTVQTVSRLVLFSQCVMTTFRHLLYYWNVHTSANSLLIWKRLLNNRPCNSLSQETAFLLWQWFSDSTFALTVYRVLHGSATMHSCDDDMASTWRYAVNFTPSKYQHQTFCKTHYAVKTLAAENLLQMASVELLGRWTKYNDSVFLVTNFTFKESPSDQKCHSAIIPRPHLLPF